MYLALVPTCIIIILLISAFCCLKKYREILIILARTVVHFYTLSPKYPESATPANAERGKGPVLGVTTEVLNDVVAPGNCRHWAAGFGGGGNATQHPKGLRIRRRRRPACCAAVAHVQCKKHRVKNLSLSCNYIKICNFMKGYQGSTDSLLIKWINRVTRLCLL